MRTFSGLGQSTRKTSLERHLGKGFLRKYALVAALFLASAASAMAAADPASGDSPSREVYSNMTVHPVTSDCGGFALTLVVDHEGALSRGFLKAYEGNCEDVATPIRVIGNSKRGSSLRFTSAACAAGEQSAPCAEWRFSGTWSKREVVGQMAHCDGRQCVGSQHLRLRRLKHAVDSK